MAKRLVMQRWLNEIKQLNDLDDLTIEMLKNLLEKEKDYLSEIISGKVKIIFLLNLLRGVKFVFIRYIF